MSEQQPMGGAPDGVVWDGTAWVSPATGHRWDGTAWLAPAAPVTPVAPAAPFAPVPGPPARAAVTRGTVFWQVAWRAMVVAVVGGAVVGMVGISAAVAFDVAQGGLDDDQALGLGFLPVVGLVGALFGVLLGLVAAPVLGGICAWRLVPYPGARTTRLLPRLVSMALVALSFPLLVIDTTIEAGTLVVLGAFAGLSLAGAWLGGGWMTGWYVRRAGAVPGR